MANVAQANTKAIEKLDINISKQILHDLKHVKDSANDDTYQGHMDQLFRHHISTPLHTITEVSLITIYKSDIIS